MINLSILVPTTSSLTTQGFEEEEKEEGEGEDDHDYGDDNHNDDDDDDDNSNNRSSRPNSTIWPQTIVLRKED